MVCSPSSRAVEAPLSSARGITLIELVVSLTIAAMLFAAVVVGVGALTGVKAKSAAGELSGVIRSLYDTAALSGHTCRLVFRLPTDDRSGERVRYWAECAKGNITAASNRDEALRQANQDEADRLRNASRAHRPGSSDFSLSSQNAPTLQELMAREKDRVEAQAQFAQYTASEIKPRELPSQVHLSIWTTHQREPVSSGLAFLYFFPQGYTEKAMVFVRQDKNVWTISVSPLTGKTFVVADELQVPRS